MSSYVFKRMVQLIPVLIGITIITFGLMYLSPSDPALMMLNAQGVAPSPELLEQTRHEMGLDVTFWEQYRNWITGLFTGDLGYSYKYNADVTTVLAKRLPVTALLSLCALVLVLVVAAPLGILSATHQNKTLDYIIQFFQFFSLSMPSFWLGLLFIYFFSLQLGLFPSMGYAGAISLVLPAIVLSISFVGRLIGQIRISVIEELQKPYVTGLISRGIPFKRVVNRHVIKNALVPSVTLIGIAFGGMLSGSVVIETVFSLPGLGFMALSAITARDYALIQGYVLFVAVAYVLINLIVDLSYHALNPSIRLGASHGHD